MNLANNSGWQIVASVTTIAAAAGLALWLVFRRRPSAEEIERARRQFLVQSGRLVDGMLLDVYDVEDADCRALTFLLFSYRIAGVDYECSQEITALRDTVEVGEVRAGFPCTVRYQPGNPYNSIVISEGWTGLRAGLPQFPSIDDPNPLDTSHLEPGAHQSPTR
ncbi:MAG: hypothetical protein WAL45_01825 [Terracidiphilus sp.]